MGLADIAEGIEVTETQRDRGVATVDDTGATLAERLEPFAPDLPCSPAETAAVLDRYAAGGNVGAAAEAADVAPVTAAKALYLLGESVSPVGETGRAVVRDWIAGDLSRSEALELARVSEAEFALAAYVETHDRLEDAQAAIEGVLARESGASLTDSAGAPDLL